MSPRARLLLASLVLASVACDGRKPLQQAAGSAEGRFARETLELVLRRDVAAVTRRMRPEVAARLTPDAAAGMLAEIPDGAASTPLLVGADSFRSDRTQRAQFTYEYPFPRGYLLGLVVVDSSGPEPVVMGLHLKRMPDSLARVNAFGFAGKTARHVLVFAAGLATVALILYALGACLRTRGLPRKWLWLLFVAIGIGRIRLNWTTGDLQVIPLSFRLLGVGFVAAGPYAPWFLSVSLPVGAIVFLALRRRLAARAEDDRRAGASSGVE